MEDMSGGVSSGAIRGTLLQMADVNTLATKVSPVMRMQNLEGPREMTHVTTVIRNQDATTGGVAK